jgi:hypothetical protein
MALPDVTTDPAEWEQIKRSSTVAGDARTPLWKNTVHQDVYSTDGGKTYTISTERYDPETARPIHNSRKV